MKKISGILLLLSVALQMSFSQVVKTPDLQGYKKITNYPVYKPDNLWDFIDGAAENYLAYGFEELNVVEYEKGKTTIKLEIYRHKDNIDAFGIYSSERSPRFLFIPIGAQGYKVEGTLNFFKGRYYVKIRTNSKSDKILKTMESLASDVASMLPGETSMPKTVLEFPSNGKKPDEETFINQGVLGHDFLRQAFRANYEISDQAFSIYVFDNGSAEECRKSVNTYLSKCGQDTDNNTSGKYVFQDGYNGDIFLAWKDNRFVVIQGLLKDQTELADKYASEILK